MASLLLACPYFSHAAHTAPLLIVRESGVYLYARQNIASERIVRLEKGEMLVPMTQVVGSTTWHLVSTKTGLSGWVRDRDVAPRQERQELLGAQDDPTWSVRTNDGRLFQGTWSAAIGEIPNRASGTWTLREGTGKTLSRGRWSLEKFSTGWNGTWRATGEGLEGDLAGTWTADFPKEHHTRFTDFFAAAARNVIRGIWNSESVSGSWSLRGQQ